MTPGLRKWLFETLYRNRYLYRFASTVPFAGQWRIWQRLVLPRIHGLDVLELGSGLGDLLADMLQSGYHCRAIEHSPAMLAATRDTLKRRKVGDAALVLQGSAQHLPFKDGSFDTVVSTFPSEYIYDLDTISEVERILRHGGRLIVIEGANLLPTGFIQPLLVLIQMLVYGFGPRKRRNQSEETLHDKQDETPSHKKAGNITTDVLADAWFSRLIPLEQCNLRRRSERVRSRRWEVYITIGEKV